MQRALLGMFYDLSCAKHTHTRLLMCVHTQSHLHTFFLQEMLWINGCQQAVRHALAHTDTPASLNMKCSTHTWQQCSICVSSQEEMPPL